MSFNHFDQVADQLLNALSDVVTKTAFDIQATAASIAPVDTGFLKNSIYVETYTNSTYGHTTRTRVSQGNIQCNILKPSATQLQTYADIIGAQRALVIRVMQASDVQEGDEFLYDGLYWVVNNMQDAESYTVTKEYLITVVA